MALNNSESAIFPHNLKNNRNVRKCSDIRTLMVFTNTFLISLPVGPVSVFFANVENWATAHVSYCCYSPATSRRIVTHQLNPFYCRISQQNRHKVFRTIITTKDVFEMTNSDRLHRECIISREMMCALARR